MVACTCSASQAHGTSCQHTNTWHKLASTTQCIILGKYHRTSCQQEEQQEVTYHSVMRLLTAWPTTARSCIAHAAFTQAWCELKFACGKAKLHSQLQSNCYSFACACAPKQGKCNSHQHLTPYLLIQQCLSCDVIPCSTRQCTMRQNQPTN